MACHTPDAALLMTRKLHHLNWQRTISVPATAACGLSWV